MSSSNRRASSWVIRPTSSRRRPSRCTDERRADLREVPPVGPEVHARRDQRRAGAQRERGRARRAAWCARRRSRPRRRRPRGRGRRAGRRSRFALSARRTAVPGVGPERDDLHPDRLAHAGEPLEQLRRLDRLDDDRRRRRPRPASHAAAKSKPPRCGQREDHAVALGERGRRCAPSPTRVEARLDRPLRVARQPEQLEPVAAVRGERVRHRAVERAALRARRRWRAAGSGRRAGAGRGGTARARGRRPSAIGSPIALGDRVRERGRAAVREVRRAVEVHGRAGWRRGQGRLRRAARAWRRASRRASGRRCSRQRASIGDPVASLAASGRSAPVPGLEELAGGRAGPRPGATP